MNIRVDLNYSIKDGTEVVFRSPVDCSQVTGLKVHYLGADGAAGSKEFAFADAHGNNVGDIDHLFAENVAVKVILDVTTGMAFVQNADTNTYLENKFAETIDKCCPSFTESGTVAVCEPVEGYHLDVVSNIVHTQSGSGTSSPDNVRKITGHGSINLSITGKNLFGGEAFADAFVAKGATKNAEAGTIAFPGKMGDKDYNWIFRQFNPNTQYTFILYGKNSASKTFNLAVWYTEALSNGATYEIISPSAVGADEYVVYTSRPGKTIRAFGTILYLAGDTTLHYDKCGIFEGVVTKDAFEECKGNTFTTELGQTVYGGTFNWNTGELSISYGSIVFDGITAGKKVAFTDAGAKTYAYFQPILNGSANLAKPKKGGSIHSDRVGCFLTGSNSEYVGVGMKQEITGVTDSDTANQVVSKINAVLESWYNAGTPLLCIYELNKPITVKLTPQEIIAMSGTNNLFSNTGDTEVSGKSDPTAVIQDLYNKLNALSATMAALTGV